MTDIRRVETLMRGHEARPFQGPNTWRSDWYQGPFLTTGHRMHGDALPGWYDPAPFPRNDWWRYLVPWFFAFGEEDPANPYATLYTATNCRVQTRNIRLFVRRSSWALEQTIESPISDNFSYTLTGNALILSGHRSEASNGGGTSHPIRDGATNVPHGYGVPFFVADPQNVTGVAIDMDCRIILDNPAGVDDRAQAKAVMAIACDLYYNQGSPSTNVGYWPAVGAAGYARITSDWARIGFNSYFSGSRKEMNVNDLRAEYSSALILASAPPGWTDGGSAPVPPASAKTYKILCFGDSFTRGGAGDFASYRKPLQDLLSAGGHLFDFVGDQSDTDGGVTDLEHSGIGGAGIDGTVDAAKNTTTRVSALLDTPGYADIIVDGCMGWNDAYNAPTNTGPRYQALVDAIRARSTAPLILGTMTPQQNQTEAQTNADVPAYAQLNARKRTIASASSTDNIVLADCAAMPMAAADWDDVIHWTPAGAAKAAQQLYAAMLPFLSAAAPAPLGTQKLLLIGDDYVRGNESVAGSHRTWRGRTLTDLTAAGLSVDAIGREVSASALRPTDPEHDGYSGARISTTANNIADRLDAILTSAGGTIYASGGADGAGAIVVTDARSVAAAVLMLGLADYESEPTGIADRYGALFADVRAALPVADLVVVTLPPRQGLTEAATNAAYPGYAALNSRIRQIAADTYGVTLANAAAAALVPADYQGAALLLQSGADKVGAIIATALRTALGAGGGYIIPGAPARPTVSLKTVSSKLHVFRWGSTPAAPAIVTEALTGGQVGQPYLVDLEVTGDPAPTVTVSPTAPFPGVALAGSRISGTPTTAGSYTFTVSASSSAGSTAARTFTLNVTAPTVITTTTLPSIVAGAPFAIALQATGSGPFTWSISDRGTLPAGPAIVVDTLSGAVASAGVYTFTVAAVGQSGSDTQALSLTVTEDIVAPTPESGSWVRIPRNAEVWVRVPRDES